MTSGSIILGIDAYHADAAARIVRGGTLLAAAEEERFRHNKHWAGVPSRAIRYYLNEAKVELSDVSHVAVNRSGRTNLLRTPRGRLLVTTLGLNPGNCARR